MGIGEVKYPTPRPGYFSRHFRNDTLPLRSSVIILVSLYGPPRVPTRGMLP